MALTRRAIVIACLTLVAVLSLLASTSSRRVYSTTSSPPPILKRTLRILPIGDSITYGLGSSTHNGYRQHFEEGLERLGYNIIMEGTQTSGTMTGDNNRHEGYPLVTVQQVHNHLQPILTHEVVVDPDFVNIHIGTNDIGFLRQAADIIHDLTQLLDDIFLAFPDTCIVLSQIIDCICAGDMPRELAEYNSMMQELASAYIQQGRHLVLVDQDNVRLREGDGEDLVHPNDGGYFKMAKNFARGVEAGIEKGFARS